MTSVLVQKLWSYCNILRDDGMSYGDYVEQLTFLLFLKMADERAQKGTVLGQAIPRHLNWDKLLQKEEGELFEFYSDLLLELGKKSGTLGLIFYKAQNKFADPFKLRRLIVELIDKQDWSEMSDDVKGDAYEGLLQKNAQDTKSGAGQYFTPRALVDAIVDAIDPKLGETVCDPACGTAGFLLSANSHIRSRSKNLSQRSQKVLREKTFTGFELVPGTARLAAMNMLLHDIGGENMPIIIGDALMKLPVERYDVVLSNPPFGKKSATTIGTDSRRGQKEGDYIERSDFQASTSNKQLNFLQHIYSLLATNGRAAVVVPDNVLFDSGAGEQIRGKLLRECNVHTLLRLPAGLFYAQGIKANVLFFEKPAKPKFTLTSPLWIYDLRTDKRFTLKTSPLEKSDLDDFIACFHAADRTSQKSTWSNDNLNGRWRAYSSDEILSREKLNLDIMWLKSADQQIQIDELSPHTILVSIAENLRQVLDDISELTTNLYE
jgi:type I restriction enzyme M protein